MACSLMPETIAERCEDFVAKYGDMIIQVIIHIYIVVGIVSTENINLQTIVDAEMNPESVCSSLSLCLTVGYQGKIQFELKSHPGK